MSISYSVPRSWKLLAISPLPHHLVPGHVLGSGNWKPEKIVVGFVTLVVLSVPSVDVSVLLRTVRVRRSTSSHWDMSLFICWKVISNGRLILLNCFSSCSPSLSWLQDKKKKKKRRRDEFILDTEGNRIGGQCCMVAI